MSIVNWIIICLLVVQQLMNHGLASYVKESGIDSITKDRIVEGKLAESNQFPWAAAIYRNKFDYKEMKPTPNNHSFSCGGTIIHKYFILTAAHCVFEEDPRTKVTIYKYQPTDFRVVVGSSDIAGNSLEKLQLEIVLAYEKYNNETFENDIALLKLRQPLILNNATQLMKLQQEPVLYGQMATVAGWGLTCQSDVIINGHLRYASVKIMPFENYCPRRAKLVKEESVLCIGPDVHSSSGDSGSGMWMEKNNENYLIGIVSFGSVCKPDGEDVFTNVPHFYDWIMQNMERLQ